jgi:hypothetical protein
MRSTRFRLHVGIEGGREEDGEGERGRGRESGCMHGRVGRVSAGAIALLSLRGNSTQARDKGLGIYMLHFHYLPPPSLADCVIVS